MINKIKNKKLIKQNQGQVAIIILLASAIILTIGLSASKTTVNNTKVSTDEELLREAFNTAESAINNYLNEGSITYTASDGNNATVDSSTIGNSQSLASEGLVLANANQLFWLVNHNTDGSVGTEYYGSNSITLAVDSGFSGALKIDYFYLSAGEYKVKRLGCNYNNSSVVTGYTTDTSSCSTIDLSMGSPLLISITPLGVATKLTISGSSLFPSQGEELTSLGVTDSGVKTQIKTRYIYQIPSFLIDAITAKNIIQ